MSIFKPPSGFSQITGGLFEENWELIAQTRRDGDTVSL